MARKNVPPPGESPRHVRQVVTGLVAHEMRHHQLDDGSIDKPSLESVVMGRFLAEYPDQVAFWRDYSVADLVKQSVINLAHQQKGTFSVVGRSMKGEFRDWVQIPNDDGSKTYELKHRLDLTIAEARRMRAYHGTKEAAHHAEWRFWNDVIHAAEVRGLRPDDSVRQIIHRDSDLATGS